MKQFTLISKALAPTTIEKTFLGGEVEGPSPAHAQASQPESMAKPSLGCHAFEVHMILLILKILHDLIIL